MKVKNMNASTLRTRKRIQDAFCQMHNEGIPGDQMTIKDLTNRAQISRSTFYTHYNDLYDVGDQMGAELIEMIFDDFSICTKDDVKEVYRHFLSVMQKYSNTIRMLLRSDYPPAFFQMLQGQMKQRLYLADVEDKNWNVRMAVLVDGTIQQVITWLRREDDSNAEAFFAGLMESCDRLL